MLKTNLKKLVKLTGFCLINQKKKIMITLGTQPLKMVAVAKEVLVDLVVLAGQIFQIFLKIFLEILVVAEEDLEEKLQIIEVLI